MKKVLVACGAGAVTSTSAIMKIKERLKEEGMKAEVDQYKVMEVKSNADNYDLVVSTTNFNADSIDTPYVQGLSLVTGVGVDKTLDEIVSILKED